MRKALIIAYYWPPSGGGGVQRWLKFTRYLQEFGWSPIVYTPENPQYPDTDPSLVADIAGHVTVITQPIWEPYQLYRMFTGEKKEAKVNPGFFEERKKQSFAKKTSIWIRGNFFIPDARKFWIKPSIRFLKSCLEENPVDVIISTGTPHSMHLIGEGLHAATGIPWVADFRDPWTNIEFYDSLMLSNWADRKHRRLEKRVVQNADVVTTVSWQWAEDFRVMGAKKVETITNGYDEADFSHKAPPKDKQFTLRHLGTFAGDRNPVALWEALVELCKEEPGFEEDLLIELIGKTDQVVVASAYAFGLEKNLTISPYLPHADAILKMQSSQLLLLLINQVSTNALGRIAGKLFEYMASQSPILCLGPATGDAARIVTDCKAGAVCDPTDKSAIKKFVRDRYMQFKLGDGKSAAPIGYEAYSRKNLSKKLANVLDSIVNLGKN